MNMNKHILTELVNSNKPGSYHWVHVTHVNNPLSFFARPTKYDAFLLNIERHVPSVKFNKVSVHQRIVFKLCSSSDQYIRGEILNICVKDKEIICDIFAFDYGSLHKSISLKDIWECKNSLADIPPLALHCQLANCLPLGGNDWSDDAIEAIKYYFGKEKAKMKIIDRLPDKLVVEMINTCPDDIATLLALTGFSTLGYSNNMISRLPVISTEKKFYRFRNISINETLHVRIQYGSSLDKFYVAEVNDYIICLNNQEMVTQKAKKEKGITVEELVKGLPVCIFDEFRKSERAIVKSIIPSKSEAVVQLVDSGKEIKAHTVNMKQVPEECLTYSPCAIFCSVSQHQLLDNKLYRYLHPGYQFLITIKEQGYQFDSPNIVSITKLGKQ